MLTIVDDWLIERVSYAYPFETDDVVLGGDFTRKLPVFWKQRITHSLGLLVKIIHLAIDFWGKRLICSQTTSACSWTVFRQSQFHIFKWRRVWRYLNFIGNNNSNKLGMIFERDNLIMNILFFEYLCLAWRACIVLWCGKELPGTRLVESSYKRTISLQRRDCYCQSVRGNWLLLLLLLLFFIHESN